MRRRIACPQCREGGAIRVLSRSPSEFLAALFWMAPFECQHCLYRFLARRMSMGRSHSLERREHLRIPVKLCLSFSGGKVRAEGTVMDLSLGGCVIKSETRVHVDDIFYLEIILVENEPPVEVAAMVRSVSERGIAFKFLRKAQENKRLMTFIRSRAHSTSSTLSKAAEPAIAGQPHSS